MPIKHYWCIWITNIGNDFQHNAPYEQKRSKINLINTKVLSVQVRFSTNNSLKVKDEWVTKELSTIRKIQLFLSNNFYYTIYIYIKNKIRLSSIEYNKMSLLNFGLAHSELGISHFTTDLILVLAFAIVTALPMSLLRPQIQEENVKSNVFKSWN